MEGERRQREVGDRVREAMGNEKEALRGVGEDREGRRDAEARDRRSERTARVRKGREV